MPVSEAASSSYHPRQSAAGEPVWYPLPLEVESLARYGRSLGLENPATSLQALAEAIAASAQWPAAAAAMIVCRPDPRPLLAVWGRFDAADEGAIAAQAGALDFACRHLRYVRYEQASEAAEVLADRLLEHLGRDEIRHARFIAVPRGGLMVLGLLAVILDLPPRQLEPPKSADDLLVVADDCAFSGLRFAESLARHQSRRVVFAPLFSPPQLRAAITRREPRVVACLSGHDLAEREVEDRPRGWRRRWSERESFERYWIGRPETLCFPWGEPDRAVWNPVRQRAERAWRIVPASLCLKNRPPAGADPVPIRVQPEGRGDLRPADRVLFAELEGSIALGNLASGESFRLEGVAADVWRRILRHGDVRATVADLARGHQAPTLRRDVEAFVARLTRRGLLRQPDQPGHRAPAV